MVKVKRALSGILSALILGLILYFALIGIGIFIEYQAGRVEGNWEALEVIAMEIRIADSLSELSKEFGEEWRQEMEELLREPLTWESQSIYFDSGATNITEESLIQLDFIVEDLLGRENLIIFVEGNCHPGGGGEQQMSEDRARTVVNLLKNRGIDAMQWIVIGNGVMNPKAANNSAVEIAKNRRVDIIVNCLK